MRNKKLRQLQQEQQFVFSETGGAVKTGNVEYDSAPPYTQTVTTTEMRGDLPIPASARVHNTANGI